MNLVLANISCLFHDGSAANRYSSVWSTKVCQGQHEDQAWANWRIVSKRFCERTGIEKVIRPIDGPDPAQPRW